MFCFSKKWISFISKLNFAEARYYVSQSSKKVWNQFLWKKVRKIDFLMIGNELSRSACMWVQKVLNFIHKILQKQKQKLTLKRKTNLTIFSRDLFSSRHVKMNFLFLFSKHAQWIFQVIYSARVRVNCSKCICSNLDCSTLFSKMSSARQKTSSAWQKKVCRTCSTCQFRAVDKKTASARIFEQMTKFLWQ